MLECADAVRDVNRVVGAGLTLRLRCHQLERHPFHMRRMLEWFLAGTLVVGGLGAAFEHTQKPNSAGFAPVADPDPTGTARPVTDSPEPALPGDEVAELLFVTDQKDGDSWDASDGREYRLGQVITPEYDGPCGPEATEFPRDFLASGFTAAATRSDWTEMAMASAATDLPVDTDGQRPVTPADGAPAPDSVSTHPRDRDSMSSSEQNPRPRRFRHSRPSNAS